MINEQKEVYNKAMLIDYIPDNESKGIYPNVIQASLFGITG